MRRYLERYAVLAFLAFSPLWLPSVSQQIGSGTRLGLAAVLKPALEGVRSFQVGFEHFVLGIFQWPFLQEENRFLRLQVMTLSAHEETHRGLFEENERLRALLDLKRNSRWELVPAEVIGREFGSWSRTLLIDRGQRHGLKNGMAVIAPSGLVGRLSEVGKEVSRVMLLNDPHFRVSAVASQSRDMGLVIATSSGDSLLTYIPLGVVLKEGDKVLSSGGVSFCPADIAIGSISVVVEDASRLFQTARLKPAVDLGSVEEVLVVKWPFSDSSS
ncbi:MAG: rod shape-determining protein MreC [Candidatus Omnitrophica bacterium]|nr:rod shape-determining protein MreC [Candidatus Omnitrophota bacterium]